MDKEQLIGTLCKYGFSGDRGATQLEMYAVVSYASFNAQQVNNRSSASWKTAQYIIVNYCEEDKLPVLLRRWKLMTGSYKDQYLLVYNSNNQNYDIYNHNGEWLGDDSVLNEIVEKNRARLNAPRVEYFEYSSMTGNSANKIFYGVPGCGKSYHIQHNILEKGNYKEENIIRTTFYQDYSNTDFVGQILPKIVKGADGDKDTVEYIFNPGPFTLALIQAISNPANKVALVIEEINRGNAPAIFGDIFQLLDRHEDGVSEYGIVNVGILDYLNAYEFEVNGKKTHYTFKEVKIPGNMDIFATMNTSDQNVYTLDTAFTRRWDKERISNNFNGNEIADFLVPGMEQYTWGTFVSSINLQIQNKLDDLQVNEDKQVGAFFVKKCDLLPKNNTLKDEEKKDKAISFAHKVLEYLWDDVSKLDHSVIFNPTYKTFEKVVEDYLKNGVAVFSSEIFKNKST